MKSHWSKVQLAAAFKIALVGIITCSFNIAIAPVSAKPIKFSPPPPPPDRGAVGDRGGAASRGCSVDNQSLIALVPVYEQTLNQEQHKTIPITKVWGLTTSEHPTFWFFVPYKKSQINNIEFVLKDESSQPSQTIYRTTLKTPEVPGVISVNLPATTSALQTGKMYNWFMKMKIICNPQQPPERKYVEGWIQRFTPNPQLADSLKQATFEQQVGLYAEHGIWYDALTTLAELRLAKPQDATLATDWMKLLKSVGLDNLASQPLIKSE